MPRSWLKPAVSVQRSAFALMIATESSEGVNVIERRVESMSTQFVPSPFASWYWRVLAAENGLRSCAVFGRGDGGTPLADGDGWGGDGSVRGAAGIAAPGGADWLGRGREGGGRHA